MKKLFVSLLAILFLCGCQNTDLENSVPKPEYGVVWVSENPFGWFRVVAKSGGFYYVGKLTIDDAVCDVYGGFEPGGHLTFTEIIYNDDSSKADLAHNYIWTAYCDLTSDEISVRRTGTGDEDFRFIRTEPESMDDYEITDSVSALEAGHFYDG